MYHDNIPPDNGYSFLVAFVLTGLFIFGVLSCLNYYSPDPFQNQPVTVPKEPEVNHIPDKDGYLHDGPCHAGESATSEGFKPPVRCYVLDWNKTYGKEIKSGKCRIDGGGGLICKDSN